MQGLREPGHKKDAGVSHSVGGIRKESLGALLFACSYHSNNGIKHFAANANPPSNVTPPKI
ncbi:hypothetical protein DOT_5686 [Desulfosporosinus sp. OT]|nr:hypothetical protein DOT_5686 [Desulfosporosinus sp. OT]